MEGLTHVVEHAWKVVHLNVARARSEGEWRLLDALIVEGRAEIGFAGNHHDRYVAARGSAKRGHCLCEARPAGDRRNAWPAGRPGIRDRRGAGAMLMARVNDA